MERRDETCRDCPQPATERTWPRCEKCHDVLVHEGETAQRNRLIAMLSQPETLTGRRDEAALEWAMATIRDQADALTIMRQNHTKLRETIAEEVRCMRVVMKVSGFTDPEHVAIWDLAQTATLAAVAEKLLGRDIGAEALDKLIKLRIECLKKEGIKK